MTHSLTHMQLARLLSRRISITWGGPGFLLLDNILQIVHDPWQVILDGCSFSYNVLTLMEFQDLKKIWTNIFVKEFTKIFSIISILTGIWISI